MNFKPLLRPCREPASQNLEKPFETVNVLTEDIPGGYLEQETVELRYSTCDRNMPSYFGFEDSPPGTVGKARFKRALMAGFTQQNDMADINHFMLDQEHGILEPLLPQELECHYSFLKKIEGTWIYQF